MTGFTVNSYTPAQVTEMISRAGVHKGNMQPHRVFLSAVSAGCLLSFAAASCLTANTSTWLQTNAPGVARILGALVFPYGLVLIVLTGADLCTGTFMYTTVAVLHRRLSVLKALLHWVICFLGNLAGALFMVSIIFGYGGVFSNDPFRAEVISFTTKKQVTPAFHEIFLRGIGCNWLVCLGCFFGMQGRDLTSKVVGIWWPIFAFVSLGLDHVVANMFFIPMGIWVGNPDISVGLYIWKGIIPAGLGNILGGGLFVGGYYWYMYLWQQEQPLVDGVAYPEHADVEKGLSRAHLDLVTKRSIVRDASVEDEVRHVRETGG
ncbi:formate/nitrate family transporter [Saccharata proteae CBS 121410]|uniref:Formate/nitrate family transporter n=1 Tax=Saccharata proteae CBS 121410 TaxID=1314787 RepID=A0A6A5YAQ9_9PEZI|nr:formate/nitrate family transporter [Saccharata proteae CBS 121410]